MDLPRSFLPIKPQELIAVGRVYDYFAYPGSLQKSERDINTRLADGPNLTVKFSEPNHCPFIHFKDDVFGLDTRFFSGTAG